MSTYQNAGHIFRDQLAAMKQANTRAARATAQQIKREIRADFAAVGLGKIANNIVTKVYPERAGAVDPSILVRFKDSRRGYVSRTEKMALGHINGSQITTINGGQWLAIPTENAPRDGRGRIKPSKLGSREPLQFIQTGPNKAVLVQKQRLVRRRDGTAKGFAQLNRNSKRNITQVIVYHLTRKVTLKKRLDWAVTIARGQDIFANNWLKEQQRRGRR